MAIVKDDVERLKALYQEKNEFLKTYYEPVEQYEFYRDIFPEGSLQGHGDGFDKKPNAFAVELIEKDNGDKVSVRHWVKDNLAKLKQLRDCDLVFMSPIGYFGNKRKLDNARYLYALTYDLDGVELLNLQMLTHQMDIDFLPRASYIVNSGTGLHVYFVFQEPIPMYPAIRKNLGEFKDALTYKVWNGDTSTLEPQKQSINQGFRVVGSRSKFGEGFPVTAYRVGEKVTLEYLNEFLYDRKIDISALNSLGKIPLEKAKERYPDWYESRIVQGKPKGKWLVKRALYDWWKRQILEKVEAGHRYWSIFALGAYARKCGISRQELEADAYQFLEILNSRTVEVNNPFTRADIEAAMRAYDEDYTHYPRAKIEARTGVTIVPKIKRNSPSLPRDKHLYLARRRKADMVQLGLPFKKPEGRPSARGTVVEYQQKHPDGTIKDCIADTGLSQSTVYKYWQTIDPEIRQWNAAHIKLRKGVIEDENYQTDSR